jgi:hypothetical protein
MQERDVFKSPDMPIDLVISSMVETKTPGDMSLQEALRLIGYKITTGAGRDEIKIWIHAHHSFPPNVVPTIPLTLNKHGIIYYPEKDPLAEKHEQEPYKLCSLSVVDSVHRIRLKFEGLKNSEKRKTVELFTEFKREDFPV